MKFRIWIIISACCFITGIIVGIINPVNISLTQEYLASLEKLSEILSPYTFTMFLFIFLKNVSAILISFVFSPFLCLPPLFALIVNGWILGYVSGFSVQQNSLGYLLAGILPHGILEIPAFIIAEACALYFGANVLLGIFKKEHGRQIIDSLKLSARYLAIACIILIPAAIIETYLTPTLLK